MLYEVITRLAEQGGLARIVIKDHAAALIVRGDTVGVLFHLAPDHRATRCQQPLQTLVPPTLELINESGGRFRQALDFVLQSILKGGPQTGLPHQEYRKDLGFIDVITSYSIHYTKLYESAVPDGKA